MDFEDHYGGGCREWQANYEDDFDEFDRTKLDPKEDSFDLVFTLTEMVGMTMANRIIDYIHGKNRKAIVVATRLDLLPVEDRFAAQVNSSEFADRLRTKIEANVNVAIVDWRKDVQIELERFSHKDVVREYLIQNGIFRKPIDDVDDPGLKIDLIIIEYFGKPCKNCAKTEQEGDIHYQNCRNHPNFKPLPLATPSSWYRGRQDPLFTNQLMIQDHVRLYEWQNGDLIEFQKPTREQVNERTSFIKTLLGASKLLML